MSGFRTSFNVDAISPFLSFFAAHFAGRQSATAAVEIKATEVLASPSFLIASKHAASISLALTTSTRFTPFGVLSATGPAISTTSCPRRAASAAIANPILPVEGFDRNLTGSKCSLVGPAVTTTRIMIVKCSVTDKTTGPDRRPYRRARDASQ